MTPEQEALLNDCVFRLKKLELSDRYRFEKDLDIADLRNIMFSSLNGSKIGASATDKLSFWGVAPVAQPSSTGTTSDMTVVGGTAVTESNGFGGNFGTKYYTIGDIVKHLKTVGILKKNT